MTDEEKKEQMRIYKREFARKPEQKLRQKIYRENNKEKQAETDRIYYQNNKVAIAEKAAIYREENKEEIALKKKLDHQKNPEKSKIRVDRWLENNREHWNACTRKREARKKLQTPAWADKKAIKEFYDNCPDGFEVDHIIPITHKSVAGLHILENLQYLPRVANREKKNKFLSQVKTMYGSCCLPERLL